MTGRNQNADVKKYLKKLSKELSHLSAVDREDIAREIEEHILERWETDSEGSFDDSSLQGVLGKMGSPEYIAGQYCDQRGWAKPPVRHTLRNALIVTATAIVLICAFGGYFSYKYILSPFAGIFGGAIVEVDDDGVRILNGAISVGENGVKISGVRDVSDDGVKIDGGEGNLSLGGIKIDGKFNRVSIDKLLGMTPIVEDEGTINIEAKGLKGFDIEFYSGDLKIKGGDVEDVRIDYKKMVYGSDKSRATKLLADMAVVHEVDDGMLEINGEDPLSDALSYPDGINGVAYVATIIVPRRMEGEVECKNCKLDIANLEGPLNIDAKFGETRVVGVKKGLKMDGKFGRMDIEDIGGDLQFDGKYGEATVKNIMGAIDVDAKYGNMNIDNVMGDIGIDAKYGHINLKLSEGYEFEFEGRSKFGDIDCNFPAKKSGELLTAKIGSGKNSVKIDSKFGNVNVSR